MFALTTSCTEWRKCKSRSVPLHLVIPVHSDAAMPARRHLRVYLDVPVHDVAAVQIHDAGQHLAQDRSYRPLVHALPRNTRQSHGPFKPLAA